MTQLKTSVTLTIEVPGQQARAHRVDAPMENPSNQQIHEVIELLKIWAEDVYPVEVQ